MRTSCDLYASRVCTKQSLWHIIQDQEGAQSEYAAKSIYINQVLL